MNKFSHICTTHGWEGRIPCPVCEPTGSRTVAPKQTTLREKTSAERKDEPIHSGCLMYFPDALAAIARHSKKANVKHNGADAPLGWTRGKSNDHEDCLIRHDLTPGRVDPETGEIEAVARAWRAMADLQIREEARLAAAGIMPYSGIVPAEAAQDGD